MPKSTDTSPASVAAWMCQLLLLSLQTLQSVLETNGSFPLLGETDFCFWESLGTVHTGREAFPPGRSTQTLLPARQAHTSKELLSLCWQQPRWEAKAERDFSNFLAIRGKADSPHLPEIHCRIIGTQRSQISYVL